MNTIKGTLNNIIKYIDEQKNTKQNYSISNFESIIKDIKDIDKDIRLYYELKDKLKTTRNYNDYTLLNYKIEKLKERINILFKIIENNFNNIKLNGSNDNNIIVNNGNIAK